MTEQIDLYPLQSKARAWIGEMVRAACRGRPENGKAVNVDNPTDGSVIGCVDSLAGDDADSAIAVKAGRLWLLTIGTLKH